MYDAHDTFYWPRLPLHQIAQYLKLKWILLTDYQPSVPLPTCLKTSSNRKPPQSLHPIPYPRQNPSWSEISDIRSGSGSSSRPSKYPMIVTGSSSTSTEWSSNSLWIVGSEQDGDRLFGRVPHFFPLKSQYNPRFWMQEIADLDFRGITVKLSEYKMSLNTGFSLFFYPISRYLSSPCSAKRSRDWLCQRQNLRSAKTWNVGDRMELHSGPLKTWKDFFFWSPNYIINSRYFKILKPEISRETYSLSSSGSWMWKKDDVLDEKGSRHGDFSAYITHAGISWRLS